MPNDLTPLSQEEIEAEKTVSEFRGAFIKGRNAVEFLIDQKTWLKRGIDQDAYFSGFGILGLAGAKKLLGEGFKKLDKISFNATGDITITIKPAPILMPEITADSPPEDLIPDTPAEAEARIKAGKKTAKRLEKEMETGKRDRAGHVVPSYLMELFANADKWMDLRQEAITLGRSISTQARQMGGESIITEKELLYFEKDENERIVTARCTACIIIAELIDMHTPYSVCPSCKGTAAIDDNGYCGSCVDRGWLTQDEWIRSPYKEELVTA